MNFKSLIKNPKPYVILASEKMKSMLRAYFGKGKKVHCEICKWNGNNFFNGKCPKCNSLRRTRLIPFSLRHFGLVKNNLSILHIAPNLNEYNYIKNTFQNFLQYDRLNIQAAPHINLEQDITKTDIVDNTYDLVIVWHVLEHIVDDKKAASEIYRILKPKGNLLMSVPIHPKGNMITYEDASIPYMNYTKVHGHPDHCRSCGMDYYERFENVGFSSKILQDYEAEDLKKYGLSKDHVVWCFNK